MEVYPWMHVGLHLKNAWSRVEDQHHLFDPDPSFSNHLAGAHTLVVEGQTYSGSVQFPPIFRQNPTKWKKPIGLGFSNHAHLCKHRNMCIYLN